MSENLQIWFEEIMKTIYKDADTVNILEGTLKPIQGGGGGGGAGGSARQEFDR